MRHVKEVLSVFALPAAVIAGVHSYKVLADIFKNVSNLTDIGRQILALSDGELGAFVLYSAIVIGSIALVILAVAALGSLMRRSVRKSWRSHKIARRAATTKSGLASPKKSTKDEAPRGPLNRDGPTAP